MGAYAVRAAGALSICAAATVGWLTPAGVQAIVVQQQAAVQSADSVYDLLFAGIKLDGSKQSQARVLLSLLEQRQAEQDAAFTAAQTAERVKMTALQTKRDAELRLLLATDADRQLFESRTAATMGGAGGRGAAGGGGAATGFVTRGDGSAVAGVLIRDSAAAGTRVITRADGGGRGGAGGRGVATVTSSTATGAGGTVIQMREGAVITPQAREDMTYTRLFNGITLSPQQEVRARQLITVHENARTPVARPPMLVRMNRNAGKVIVQQDTHDSLLSLVATKAEHDLLKSRLTVIVVR